MNKDETDKTKKDKAKIDKAEEERRIKEGNALDNTITPQDNWLSKTYKSSEDDAFW